MYVYIIFSYIYNVVDPRPKLFTIGHRKPENTD